MIETWQTSLKLAQGVNHDADCPAKLADKTLPTAGTFEEGKGVCQRSGMVLDGQGHDSAYFICTRRSGKDGLAPVRPCGGLSLSRIQS